MTSHLTQVRVRMTDGEYRLTTVLAGVKVAGFTFLIHSSVTQTGKYSATYAPIGIGITDYDSIPELITALENKADRIEHAIADTVKRLAQDHIPMLAPENGIQTEDWHYREQWRFESGEYRAAPPIHGREYPRAHYVHLSVTKTESDFVAYTPSDAYGNADRQVRLKFGKYLRKTFADMPDSEIQNAVVSLRAQLALEESPATLCFATDRDTISQIFETEMYACDSNYTSCMHGKFTGRETRPYHVYADSPDVAVAYVMEHGSIIARSVVSTRNKRWIRAYSVRQNDSTFCRILTDMLVCAGYESGSLTGSRLTKLPSRSNGPVLPYIDHGGMGVTDCGRYWEVCDESDGEYVADRTDGTPSSRTPKCSGCDRDEDECECIYGECCEDRFPDGCERCSMCEQCDRCYRHDACQCARCSECSEIINPNSRHTIACDCDRCGECGELDSECECDKCEECAELTENCTCEPEESEESEETERETEIAYYRIKVLHRDNSYFVTMQSGRMTEQHARDIGYTYLRIEGNQQVRIYRDVENESALVVELTSSEVPEVLEVTA